MTDVSSETVPIDPWRLEFYVHLTEDLFHAVDWRLDDAPDGVAASTTTFRTGGGTVHDRGELRVRVERGRDGFSWHARAEFANPTDRIKGVRAVLGPVPGDRVQAPTGHEEALTPHTVLHYVYPFIASADPATKAIPLTGKIPMPVIGIAQGGRTQIASLSTVDYPPRMEWFGASLAADGAVLHLFTEEPARRWRNEYESPRCIFRAATTWDEIVEESARSMEASSGVVPFDRRSDIPDWAREIALAVEVHGLGYFGEVNLTFDEMGERLAALARRFPARETLVTIWGWGGRHDRGLPYETPAAELGGEDGFSRLLDGAHDLGFRTAPLGNVQAVGEERFDDLLPRFQNDRVFDLIGRPRGFYFDWDRDGVAEDVIQYVSPDSESWRAYQLQMIDTLFEKYRFDGYFFDQTNGFYNDPYHDHFRGIESLLHEFQSRHPDKLVIGESMQDYLMALTPFGTVGTGPMLLGGSEPTPADRLYNRYVRRFGQLLLSPEGRWGVLPRGISPAPVDDRNPKDVQPPQSDPFEIGGRMYQREWLDAGIMPTLTIANRTVDLEHPGVAQILEYAEQYRTDWV